MASLIERHGTYYLQWRIGKTIKRQSLHTESLQIAKEKLRQFESGQAQGIDNPLPSRTPVAQIVGAYIRHMRTIKTPKSAQTDTYYLREVFGPICDELKITSRRITEKARKKALAAGEKIDARTAPRIEIPHFEALTTAHIVQFIASQVRRRGLAPKTANRYREILCRLVNWSTKQHGIRMPGNVNPAKDVERYKEKQQPIRYLTLEQIDEQLHALRFNPQLQTMVALLIYAGVRRGELLWLTNDDVDLTPRTGGHGMLRIRPKEYAGETWHGKTAGSVRAIPISSTLRGYLDRYAPRPSDGPGRGWFFPSPDGKRWEEDNFSADLRLANGKYGLIWACLDYRHTFGSHLAQNGVSLYKISQLMGNSPEICRCHYAALSSDSLIEDVMFEPKLCIPSLANRQPLNHLGA